MGVDLLEVSRRQAGIYKGSILLGIVLSIPAAIVLAQPDTTPPETFIDGGPAEGSTITTGSVTFAFHATDPLPTTCAYRLDPIEPTFGTPDSCGTVKTYSNLETGTYTFLVRGHDSAGNIDPTPASRTFIVDRGPDPLLANQWHLKARSVEVAGANVEPVWPGGMGSGIAIGIVDDGLQHTHPDLQRNYSAALSWDFNYVDSDPSPDPSDAHGTSVAGIAAARIGNAIGVSGVAPHATLAGLRLLGRGASDSTESLALGYKNPDIHILNSSWGPLDDGATVDGPGPLTEAAIEDAVRTGRGGRGRIFVWAAGNGRKGTLESDNCNFDGYATSRFGIAVGAVNDLARQTAYSESCSALFVTAPSGDGARRWITTTTLTGYTGSFGGTSAAAPLVSGVVALMLQRNPALSWRDVQYILRETSSRSAIDDPSADWSPGSVPHSERYGFGLVDAEAAVGRAATWTGVPPESAVPEVQHDVGVSLTDGSAAGVDDTITIGAAYSGVSVEHVEVEFTASHARRGDLRVTLTSPAGVVSQLGPPRASDTYANFSGWRFRSVRHWGETASGNWTLRVADVRTNGVTGTFTSWRLRIYGTIDGTPPVVSVPDPVTLEAVGAAGAAATFSASALDTIDGPLPATCTPASGSTFAIGTTTVTCTATDAHGNTGTASFSVTVVDTTPPAVTVPADATLFGAPPSGLTHSFSATAADAVDGALIPSCTPGSGSLFPVGSTTVTCTAADAHLNVGSAGFTVTVVPAITSTTIVADPTSPQAPGTSITFTAAAAGGVGPHQFKWLLYDGTTWTVLQDWSTAAAYMWTPATANASYYVAVVARSAGNTADAFEQAAGMSFSIVSSVMTGITLTADLAAPQLPGTEITFTTAATGGAAPQQFKWLLYDGTAWTVLRDWNTATSFIWTPATANENYYIAVVARSAGNTTDQFEQAAGMSFPIVGSVMTGVTLTADHAAPQLPGTEITFSAAATGGAAPQQFKWLLYDGTTWTVLQNWSTAATCTWTPSAANANYYVAVVARSAGNTTDRFEQAAGMSFPIVGSVMTGVMLTADHAAPQLPGTEITFSAAATGGATPHQFKWLLYDGSTWTVLQDWSTAASCMWTPATANANYYVAVVARSAGNTTDRFEQAAGWSFPIVDSVITGLRSTPDVYERMTGRPFPIRDEPALRP